MQVHKTFNSSEDGSQAYHHSKRQFNCQCNTELLLQMVTQSQFKPQSP
jgi:hypothetical protein